MPEPLALDAGVDVSGSGQTRAYRRGPGIAAACAGLAVAAAAFWFWARPWRAVQLGGDEGIELGKMLLAFKAPQSLGLCWSEMTWFYPQIFAGIFQFTGFHAWVPRLATFVLVVAMCMAFWRLMPSGAGWPHLLAAWCLLWAQADLLELWMTAMLEAPTFALAVIGVAFLPRNGSEWSRWRFMLAGVFLALGLQVKFTAALVLPAAAIAQALVWRSIVRQSPRPRMLGLDAPILGFAAGCVVFLLIVWWAPVWNWALLWSTHHATSAMKAAQEHAFDPATFFGGAPAATLGAALAIFLLARQRRLGEAAFPLAMLITVVCVHMVHRPYWSYYGVHLAIPLSILAGWATGELFCLVTRKEPRAGDVPAGLDREWSLLLGAAIVALWAGFQLPEAKLQAELMRLTPSVADSEEIRVLERYRGGVKWVYTNHNALAAQAGYLQPPELTVVTLKRIWLGEINEAGVIQTVKKYDCELLILRSREFQSDAWKQFTDAAYVNVWSSGDETIYVARRLHP